MAIYQHRTIIAGDIKTHFLEAGSGPDLILLHGGEYGASAEITWRYNIDALAAKFHVVAPDLLGWGQTEKIYSFSDPAGLRMCRDCWKPWESTRHSLSAIRLEAD